MKIRLALSITALLMSTSLVADTASYAISSEDEHLLNELPAPEVRGAEYARCKEGVCYILKTGEVIGEGQDGIYLVWPQGTESDNTDPLRKHM